MSHRYYIYVSDTKVDMLFDSMPQNVLSKIAAELSVDLSLLGIGSVNVGLRYNDNPTNRFEKL